MSSALAQAAAFDDARALAVEIGHGIPSHQFDAMNAGLVLFPDETAYRWVGAWLVVQDAGSWAPPSWAQILITDQRLLCRFHDGRIFPIHWTETVGVQIALHQQCLLLSCGYRPLLTLSGPGVAAIAIAAVSKLYGVAALITHPALSPLRYDGTS